jgi:integrase
VATIREKSKGQWQVQIRRKGWPFQSGTFRTRKEAQAWARKTESEMDRGLFVDQTAARETTLADLIHAYIEGVTENRHSENARISERLRLERFLRTENELCSYYIINLRPEHFEAFRDRQLKQQVSRGNNSSVTRKTIAPSTVKRELNLLKRVIDYRRRWLGIQLNPVNAQDVKRPTVQDERDVRLSDEEREALMQACGEARNTLLAPFVELGFETGARRGNLLRLEWTDVNLKQGTALLRGMKNSRNPDKIINHTIGLSLRAVEILKALPRTEARVFPMTSNAMRKAFNYARKKAGLTHFRFHDTRHERISSLFEAGWAMPQVMAQSGHRDPKSVMRYTNLSGDYLAKQLARL